MHSWLYTVHHVVTEPESLSAVMPISQLETIEDGSAQTSTYRKVVPDLHRSVGGVGALEHGVWTPAAADAGDTGHAHVLVTPQRPNAHHL